MREASAAQCSRRQYSRWGRPGADRHRRRLPTLRPCLPGLRRSRARHLSSLPEHHRCRVCRPLHWNRPQPSLRLPRRVRRSLRKSDLLIPERRRRSKHDRRWTCRPLRKTARLSRPRLLMAVRSWGHSPSSRLRSKPALRAIPDYKRVLSCGASSASAKVCSARFRPLQGRPEGGAVLPVPRPCSRREEQASADRQESSVMMCHGFAVLSADRADRTRCGFSPPCIAIFRRQSNPTLHSCWAARVRTQVRSRRSRCCRNRRRRGRRRIE